MHLSTSCWLLQVTALGTVIVGSSATLFAWHLSSDHETLASVHPPLMYCLLLALLLLPADFAYKVCIIAWIQSPQLVLISVK